MPQIDFKIRGIAQDLVGRVALSHREVEEYVEDALERSLQRDNLQRMIDKAVNRAVDEEVMQFFNRGPGEAAVRAAVKDGLTAALKAPRPEDND